MEELAALAVDADEAQPGFELEYIALVSATVARSHHRFTLESGCGRIESFGLYVIATDYIFQVRIAVCQSQRWRYDNAFVERVFGSFEYDDE